MTEERKYVFSKIYLQRIAHTEDLYYNGLIKFFL